MMLWLAVSIRVGSVKALAFCWRKVMGWGVLDVVPRLLGLRLVLLLGLYVLREILLLGLLGLWVGIGGLGHRLRSCRDGLG
jgi:hypothetical protein